MGSVHLGSDGLGPSESGARVPVPVLGPPGLLFLAGLLIGVVWRTHRRGLRTSVAVAGALLAVAVPFVALAALTLPHSFSNGTIADADEVNENLESIVEDFARYHLTVTAATAGTSTPVPDAVITQL